MSSLSPPPHDHDALLQALASGDLDPGDERARDELARCAECRAEAEVMLARIRRLEAAAEEQRRDLAAASALESAPGEDGIARLLASLAGAQPPRRRVPRRALLAAAGLLLAAAGWWLTRGAGEAPAGPGTGAEYLGAPLHDLVPSGTDQSFDEFRWVYDQGHDGEFGLRVYAAGGTGIPLLDLRPLRTQTWTPTPAQRALLPDRIVWEVEALDASGEVESGPVSASASRLLD